MGADPSSDRLFGGLGPRAAAARNSARITLAACTGFYLSLYVWDQTVAATYALFAAVALGGLSRVPGNGKQRAAVVVRLLPVAWLLVTAGTMLAVRTWAAVAGMLLIGFALAFVAAGGPRPAGAAPGLQLLYILPSFPPYAPDTLGVRLGGASLGIVLLVLTDLFLLPEPRDTSYRQLAARAATTAARCVDELLRPPYVLSAQSATAAHQAGQALRPLNVADAERPAGPQVIERALAHAGLSARTLLARLVALPPPVPGTAPGPVGRGLLASLAVSSRESAAALRSRPVGRWRTEHPVSSEGLTELRACRARLGRMDTRLQTAPALRRHAALDEIADAALNMAAAARLARYGRAAADSVDPVRFWYASLSAPHLWLHRLAGHAGRRSVYFQNAVRISLALAAARAVAGLDSLPHGFWALLATLTLTRTTVTQTRTTIRQALAGTVLGALVSAALLVAIGQDTTWYAVALPPLMLTAFYLGPLRGVGWAQGLFTLVVALVFAQLAPVTWQLAEFRVLDVLVGSSIGIVFGLFAWPRGAHFELSRSVGVLLRVAADLVAVTVLSVAAGRGRSRPEAPSVVPMPLHPPVPADDQELHHALVMAESAFAQYQTEQHEHDDPPADWQAALMAGHHALWGARRLRDACGDLLDETATTRLARYAGGTTEGLRRAAAQLETADATPGADGDGAVRLARQDAGAAFSLDRVPPLYYAATEWLDCLTADLDRLASGPGRRPASSRP